LYIFSPFQIGGMDAGEAEAVFTPAVIAAAADAKAKRVRLENLAFIMVSLKKNSGDKKNNNFEIFLNA